MAHASREVIYHIRNLFLPLQEAIDISERMRDAGHAKRAAVVAQRAAGAAAPRSRASGPRGRTRGPYEPRFTSRCCQPG
jgi:hypothetical protein